MSLNRSTDSTQSQVYAVTLPDPTRTSVSAWLRDLPLANTAYSFEALTGTLESFNGRIGLSPVLRVELAELMRPAVLTVAQRAETHFLDSSLPYPAEAASHLKRGLALHSELQLAYALPCLNPAFAGLSAKGGGSLGQALYRAFQQAGLVLLWTTQLYRQPDEEYWTLLYRLYRIAEAQHLLRARIEEAAEPESCRSVEGAFKRCLLFHLANSRRLRQRDMAQVYAVLGEWGGCASVGPNVAHDGHPAEFAMSLGSGRPPQRARSLIDSEVSGLRFLCTHELVRTLMAPDGMAAAGKPRLDRSVWLRIARSLGAEEKRRSRRWPESDLCHYIIGLPGVIAALSREPAGAMPPPVQAAAGSGAEPVSGHFPTEPASASSAGSPRSELVPEEIWYEAPTAAGKPAMVEIEGKVLNSGPRGYCIVWPATAAARTKVGELIGIRSGAALFIGVIRWLECSERGWRFGVELLTPAARVVEVSGEVARPLGRALLLPIEPILRSAPELLVAPGIIRAGEVLGLSSEGVAARYRMRDLLEATPSFVRFGLLLAESAPEPR
jgi:hypothetical protein